MTDRRPALDGLRAVAVAAVVAYHLDPRLLPGGFLGVDLFFVLSGYLITGLLLREARNGPVDVIAFWIRRGRRLLPALLLMVAAVAVAVRHWEPAGLWADRRGDLIAALCYYANWQDITAPLSYFTQTAAPSPLRHMWSLAVEEQWYLLWPLVLLPVHRRRPRPATAAALLAVPAAASALIMAVTYDPGNPIRAYAGTDARAQELLIGAALALVARRATGARLVTPFALAACAGLMLLVDDAAPFYYRGGAALASVVFAALIWGVESAPDTPVARLLATAPLRGTGRVSYGIYLWHVPVIAFTPHALPWHLSGAGTAAVAAAVTLLLATGSYLLVERPVLRGRPRAACRTGTRFVTAAVAALAACATLAVTATTYATGYQAQQVDAARTAGEHAVAAGSATGAICPDTTSICVRTRPEGTGRTVAVVGDSIARSLDPGIADLAARNGWGYVLAAHNGCGLTGLLNTDGAQPKPFMRQCAAQTPARIRRLLDEHRPDLVIAYSRWELITHLTPSGERVEPLSSRWKADVHEHLRAFAQTVTRAGAKLVLVAVLPLVPAGPDCLRDPAPPACSAAPDPLTEATNRIYAAVRDEVPGVTLATLQESVCPGGTCRPVVDGVLLRVDGLHFSADGARWFVARMAPLLAPGG
ncbi:acyltransferase family protein [Dactylosporangium sp. CA-152071]|uniref:acyltransferase family protein n=1 Tax=Dactylosporangium sp. CA-152071 TaxID=3239933 RepID=UPI003D8D2675